MATFAMVKVAMLAVGMIAVYAVVVKTASCWTWHQNELYCC